MFTKKYPVTTAACVLGKGKDKMILVIGFPALAEYLQQDGFRVEVTENGRDAIRKTQTEQPDLVIVDEAAPDIDQYLNTYKQVSPTTQAIVVSRNGNLDINRVQELLSGGSRAKAIAYHTRNKAPGLIRDQLAGLVYKVEAGEWALNGRDLTLSYSGRQIDLTSREHDIMRVFIQHPDTWLDYTAVARWVYGDGSLTKEAAKSKIKSSFYRLRRKVEALAGRPVFTEQQQHGLYFDSVGSLG